MVLMHSERVKSLKVRTKIFLFPSGSINSFDNISVKAPYVNGALFQNNHMFGMLQPDLICLFTIQFYGTLTTIRPVYMQSFLQRESKFL